MTTTLPNWPNLDLADKWVVDRLHGRMDYLIREDPLMQMLSPQAQTRLLLAAFSPEADGIVTTTGQVETLTITERDEVLPAIVRAVAASPLDAVVNDGFVEHFAGLVANAIFPEQAPGHQS